MCGSVVHPYYDQLFGAQNATVGLATMTNFMMNAYEGKQ
jgi:hypothetical protein